MSKGKSSGKVSSQRLHQKSGTTVKGVTKVNHGNGTFSMKTKGK